MKTERLKFITCLLILIFIVRIQLNDQPYAISNLYELISTALLFCIWISITLYEKWHDSRTLEV